MRINLIPFNRAVQYTRTPELTAGGVVARRDHGRLQYTVKKPLVNTAYETAYAIAVSHTTGTGLEQDRNDVWLLVSGNKLRDR